MNLNPWSKPRSLILKILDLISVISIFIAIMAVLFFALWKNDFPLTSIDFSLPSYYSNKIQLLQKSIKNSTTDKAKLKGYENLLEEINGSSFLHKHYPLIEESNNFIINYLLTNAQSNESEKIAYEWQENYPFDFTAKFKYIEILKNTNPNKAIEYFENQYLQYNDIDLLISKFVDTLLDNGQFDRALQIAIESNENLITNITPYFMLMTKDNLNKEFSALGSHKILKEEYTVSQADYKILLHKDINKLQGMRFVMKKLKVRTTINELSIEINTKLHSFKNIKIKPMKSLEIINQKYLVTGIKPEIEIELPFELYDYSGELEINVLIRMDENQNFELNKILRNSQWKVNYSTDQEFQEDKKINILINQKDKTYFASFPVSQAAINYLKIELPSFENLAMKGLIIRDENQKMLNFKISEKHDLTVSNNDNFLVKGSKPYLVLEFFKPIITHTINLNFDIGNNDN